jgi:hypothetical protein
MMWSALAHITRFPADTYHFTYVHTSPGGEAGTERTRHRRLGTRRQERVLREFLPSIFFLLTVPFEPWFLALQKSNHFVGGLAIATTTNGTA